MRGTLVADGESPTSGASGFSVRVAAVRDRPRARDDDDARSGIESSFESDLHVADNIDGRGENLSQRAPDDRRHLGSRRAGASDAGVRHLRRRDPGSNTCLAHRLLQRLAGLRLSHADDVTWARSRGGEQSRFVTHRAGGLGAAPVNAKIVGHDYF